MKKTFKGGVHPHEMKALTEKKAFEKMPASKQLILPLSQHLGKSAAPIVKKGSIVKKGELIANGDGFISAPVHSPVSGVVSKISQNPNISGIYKDAIIIDVKEDEETDYLPALNPETITSEEIIERVKAAGIVGQGGAAFPTYVKLMPPEDKKIDLVIINGCECEPYLTRDFRFMIETPEKLIGGIKLIMKALGINKAIIGIEDNKPEAIKNLTEKLEDQSEIEVKSLKTKYPQGAEKILIKSITGKEVPPGELPLALGIVIQNIGTACSVYDAVVNGIPEIEAFMTVSGLGINEPKNLIVNVGTPISEILDYCGGVNDKAIKLIAGGPMMGVAQPDFNAPVTKATSGLLILTKEESGDNEASNCLRCGKCVEACPLDLMPTKLARLTQLERFEEAEEAGILVCMECGTCTFQCPANIPLVQWIRLGKQSALKIRKEKQSA